MPWINDKNLTDERKEALFTWLDYLDSQGHEATDCRALTGASHIKKSTAECVFKEWQTQKAEQP